MASRTQKRTWQRPSFPKQTTPIQRDRGQTWLTIARRYLGDDYCYRAWMDEATLMIEFLLGLVVFSPAAESDCEHD